MGEPGGRRLTPNDLIALILAVGVAVSIVLLVIGDFMHNGHVSDNEATLISTIIGAALGAIATRLGFEKD